MTDVAWIFSSYCFHISVLEVSVFPTWVLFMLLCIFFLNCFVLPSLIRLMSAFPHFHHIFPRSLLCPSTSSVGNQLPNCILENKSLQATVRKAYSKNRQVMKDYN